MPTPRTTYGTTSGSMMSAVTAGRANTRGAESASAARIARSVATAPFSAAMAALRLTAASRRSFPRAMWYQCVVKPASGRVGVVLSLNEKITSTTTGAYRNSTMSRK